MKLLLLLCEREDGLLDERLEHDAGWRSEDPRCDEREDRDATHGHRRKHAQAWKKPGWCAQAWKEPASKSKQEDGSSDERENRNETHIHELKDSRAWKQHNWCAQAWTDPAWTGKQIVRLAACSQDKDGPHNHRRQCAEKDWTELPIRGPQSGSSSVQDRRSAGADRSRSAERAAVFRQQQPDDWHPRHDQDFHSGNELQEGLPRRQTEQQEFEGMMSPSEEDDPWKKGVKKKNGNPLIEQGTMVEVSHQASVTVTAQHITEERWCLPWDICKAVCTQSARVRELPADVQFACVSCGCSQKNSFKSEWSLHQHLASLSDKGTHPGSKAWEAWGLEQVTLLPAADAEVAITVPVAELSQYGGRAEMLAPNYGPGPFVYTMPVHVYSSQNAYYGETSHALHAKSAAITATETKTRTDHKECISVLTTSSLLCFQIG